MHGHQALRNFWSLSLPASASVSLCSNSISALQLRGGAPISDQGLGARVDVFQAGRASDSRIRLAVQQLHLCLHF